MTPEELKKKILAKHPEAELQVKKDLAFQIGIHLEEARLRKGMTQEQLAQKLGSKQGNISRIEGGGSLPSLSTLKKIAEAFGTYLIPPRFAFMGEAQQTFSVKGTAEDTHLRDLVFTKAQTYSPLTLGTDSRSSVVNIAVAAF